jgi:hypothetical protein
MKHKRTRDFLIRNLPVEVYDLLEKAAKEHQRSKTQEAILALQHGLTILGYRLQQPKPFDWGKKITSRFIKKAIEDGRS